ncbi:hypothetical protein HPB48_026182 [Haemaphysalis longicornis]|uniref:Uncharacterized protein n=1 Tax=Haemaphysalis longicornis TaxID=44386 RepID=A0A9J6HBR8_HAELO|nr:hypothetical protein HPB48_026182 [Haemaphysalis longicornis]
MDRDEYYNLMRMTDAEQHELLREIIHRQTTPSAPPLRLFFTVQTGCGKKFVLQPAMDLYNRTATPATRPPTTRSSPV